MSSGTPRPPGGPFAFAAAIGVPVGLPVFSGTRRLGEEYVGDLLDERAESDQVAFRAGVRIDEALRPVRADAVPASLALFAAGSVIRGYDPASDKTGLGVAIFTGYLAGEAAAEVAKGLPARAGR